MTSSGPYDAVPHIAGMPPSRRELWTQAIGTGLLVYYLTSLLAVGGVEFGFGYLRTSPHGLAKRSDELAAFANWDGQWYQKIVTDGYAYNSARASNVAFFPAYPLSGSQLAKLTGCRVDLALVIVAHLCLAATFVLLAAYARCRFP